MKNRDFSFSMAIVYKIFRFRRIPAESSCSTKSNFISNTKLKRFVVLKVSLARIDECHYHLSRADVTGDLVAALDTARFKPYQSAPNIYAANGSYDMCSIQFQSVSHWQGVVCAQRFCVYRYVTDCRR